MTILNKSPQKIRVTSAKESTRKFSGVAKFRYESILSLVQQQEVLDIGCGLTAGSFYLATHGAKSVTGIDYSKEVVSKVSQAFQVKNLEYFWINIFEVEALKRKFDVIVAFELIEHLPVSQQTEFFDVIKKVVKPGGQLIITTPNRLIVSKGRTKPRTPFHTREFSPLELRKFVTQKIPDVELFGLDYKSKLYLRRRNAIVSSPKYFLVSFFEQFNWVHHLLLHLPPFIKQLLTAYAPIPEIATKNLRWIKTNLNQAESLMVICKL